MKLVEILAREMTEWPDSGTDIVGQAADGTLHLNESTKQNRGFTEQAYTIAEDWSQSDVTREMWQAEREKLKPKKASADGWIRHRGGKCPVDGNTVVDIRCRNGRVHEGEPAYQFIWKHSNDIGDAIAYRIHKPTEQKAPEIKVTHIENEAGVIHAESVSSSCGPITLDWQEAQDSGPLQWRDRILEIDRTVEALEEERVSLIQRLEGEGFKLLDQVNAKIAEAKQAHEDMSDCRNWKAGDVVECIKDPHTNGIKKGGLYSLTYVNSSCIGFLDDDQYHRDRGDTENFKFHHRP